MTVLEKIIKFIDAVSDRTGRIVGWIAVPMIVALIYEVFARYVFQRPTIWSYEITYMIYGTHFLLGAAYTLRVKGHIRIDLLYMRFSPRGRALIDVIGYLVIFFPIMFILVISSYDMAKDAYMIMEVSQFTPWQPILWPFKSVICVGFILLILQGIAEFIRSVVTLIRGEEIC
jgi:TRAP-type mannitol/chloroaromatic compound transport system permease small subunit